MFYVYILRSKKDSNLYVGYTSNLKKRYIEHNKGRVKSTKDRRPLYLVYCEPFYDKRSAKNRERFLKNTPSGGILKKKLARTFSVKELKYYLRYLKKLN